VNTVSDLVDGEAAALEKEIHKYKTTSLWGDDCVITEGEVEKLIEAARGGLGVTADESRLLRELYVKAVKSSEMFTEVAPELAEDGYYITEDAEARLHDFFDRHP
jgi:hypothetical protein